MAIRSLIGVFLINVLITSIWFSELSLKYPFYYFSILQSLLIILVAWGIQRYFKANLIILGIASLAGWFISYLSSLILEVICNPVFLSASKEQLEQGVFFIGVLQWLLISSIYLGVLLLPLTVYALTKNKRKCM